MIAKVSWVRSYSVGRSQVMRWKPREVTNDELRIKYRGTVKKPVLELPPENTFELQRDLRLYDGDFEGYKFIGPIMTTFNMPKYVNGKYPRVINQFHPHYVKHVFENHKNIIFMQYLNCSSNRLNAVRAKLIANERKGITCKATRLKFLSSKFARDYFDQNPHLSNLKNLFLGPVLSAVSNEDLHNLKEDYKILSTFDEALIIGAKFGNQIFTADSLPIIFNLPNRNGLMSQMVGVLASPAMHLTQTLASPAQNLSLTIQQLESNDRKDQKQETTIHEQNCQVN